MRKLSVHHATLYRYRQPVSFGAHRLMFRPRDSHDLRLIEAELVIDPPATVRWLPCRLRNFRRCRQRRMISVVVTAVASSSDQRNADPAVTSVFSEGTVPQNVDAVSNFSILDV